jgi:opacity protein-like surface antigen
MIRFLVAATAWAVIASGAMADELAGPYAGFVAGYGVAATPYSPFMRGPEIGARLGYDWTVGSVLWGVEGQVSVSDLRGDNTSPGIVTVLGGPSGPTSLGNGGSTTIGPTSIGSAIEHLIGNSDWQVDLTGRLGRTAGGIDMYFLGGFSAANDRMLNTETVNWTGAPPANLGAHPPISASATHFGVVGGAGIAVTISDRLSVFAEARYHHYFSTAYSFSNGAVATEPFSAASISTGLDWRF